MQCRKTQSVQQTIQHYQKTNSRLLCKNNKPAIPPKPPEDIKADPSIISMKWKTNIRLACKDILEINDVVCKLDAQPLIEINSSPID